MHIKVKLPIDNNCKVEMIWNRKNPRKSSTFEQFSKQNLLFEQLFCKKWKFGQNWSNLMKSLSPEHFHFFVFFKFLHFHTAVVDLWWPDSTKNTIFSSTKNALNPLEIKVNQNTKFCKKFHLNKNTPENCVDSHIFCWIWSFWKKCNAGVDPRADKFHCF